MLYNSQQPRQVRLGVSIPLGSSIAALREILQEDTGIPISRLLLIEIGKQGTLSATSISNLLQTIL